MILKYNVESIVRVVIKGHSEDFIVQIFMQLFRILHRDHKNFSNIFVFIGMRALIVWSSNGKLDVAFI